LRNALEYRSKKGCGFYFLDLPVSLRPFLDLTRQPPSISAPCFIATKIEDEIDDLLLPYRVDLSHYRNIENADLRAHIDRVGVATTNARRI